MLINYCMVDARLAYLLMYNWEVDPLVDADFSETYHTVTSS